MGDFLGMIYSYTSSTRVKNVVRIPFKWQFDNKEVQLQFRKTDICFVKLSTELTS